MISTSPSTSFDNCSTGFLTLVTGSPFAAGSRPNAATVHPSGKFLYAANESSSDISIYTIDQTSGALTPLAGSPFAVSGACDFITFDPKGRFAYVTDNNSPGNVLGFTVNAITGALTPVAGSPFLAGNSANSVVVDATGQFVYVANYSDASISAYSIDQTTGVLTSLGAAVAIGDVPDHITIDRTGKFIITSNDGMSGPGTVSVLSVNTTTGAITPVTGSPFASGAGPSGSAVDNSNRFVITANENSGSISVFAFDANTGALTAVPGSPFAGGSEPVKVAVTPTQADVSITKTGPVSVFAGQNAVFTITVKNNDAIFDATNVIVADPTPAGLTFISNSGASTTAFPCNIGTLAPGQSATITATFNVPANFSSASTTNSASVSSDQFDPTLSNNSATATVSVSPLMLSASFSPLPFAATPITNSPITFTAAVTPASAIVTWNFGDGSPTATGAVVQHIFSTVGTYTVTTTAQIPNGAATTATLTIIVMDGAINFDLLHCTLQFGGLKGDSATLIAIMTFDPATVLIPGTPITVSIGGYSRQFVFNNTKPMKSSDGKMVTQVTGFSDGGVPVVRVFLKQFGTLKSDLVSGQPVDANGNPTSETVRIQLGGKTVAAQFKTTMKHSARTNIVLFGYSLGH